MCAHVPMCKVEVFNGGDVNYLSTSLYTVLCYSTEDKIHVNTVENMYITIMS